MITNTNFGHVKRALFLYLSSPRAKRAGPKGLRAESARAFTGRRNSHSGRGEDFWRGQPIFFTETAVTPDQKVKNRSQGGKLTVMPRAKNGSSTKIEVVWQKLDFLAKNQNFGPKKRRSLFNSNHVLATTGKSCSKKKSAFAQIIKGEMSFWVIIWGKTHF